MEENEQVVRQRCLVLQIDFVEPSLDLLQTGGAQRGVSKMALSGLTSHPAARRPRRIASSNVVPRPMNGS